MKRQKIPNHGYKWRNQEGLKGLQPPFAKSLRNITPKLKGLYNPTNSKPPPQQNLVARLIANLTRWEFASKPSERPTRSL